jgi:hypothetical protein
MPTTDAFPVVYFLPLPYLRYYRAGMAHVDDCHQCYDAVGPGGTGDTEDLCPVGREWDILTRREQLYTAGSARDN